VLLDQSGPPFGLLQLTSADLLNGSARLEALVRDAVDASGYAEDFVRRAFESFPLRVVHIFAVVDVFRSEVLVPSATEVGRLTELQFRGQGRYADVTIHEIRKPSAGA
jgi:hypothetical protein